MFHSSSAGQTRSAGEVWVNDLPYLQAVSSPEQGDAIPNYYSRAEFTAEEFREKVTAALPEADLSGEMDTWLRNAVTDTAGSVETVEGGRRYGERQHPAQYPEPPLRLLRVGSAGGKAGVFSSPASAMAWE